MPSETMMFFLRRHWRAYVGLIALGIAVGIIEAASLVAFIPVMNVLVGTQAAGAAAQSNPMMATLIEWLARTGGDAFLAACALFLSLTLIKGAMALLYEYWVSRASGNVLHDYRKELLVKLRQQPLSYFADARAGDITYALSFPPHMMAKLLYILPRGAIDLFRFLSVVIVLFAIEPRVTAALGVCLAILYFALGRRMGRYSYLQASRRREAEQGMSGLATEWVHAIRPIRIAHADSHWTQGYTTFSAAARRAHVRLSMLLAVPRHVFELIAFTVFIGGVAAIYAMFPEAFRTHLAIIGVFSLGLVRVLPSVAALARMPLDVRTVLPDVEQLYRMVKLASRETDPDRQPYAPLQSELRIDGVTVEYPDRGDVLKNVSVSIRKGSVVAIVGPSGSGKSTLLNLLMGVVSPKSGSVLIDRRDIETIDRGSFLSRVGYVGQDVVLFKGTIRENIAFFRPEMPEARIRSAAATAEIAKFIESMPQGYDSPVGEGGVNLSGGQAQRIAIARAIIHDPDILLLDEATSALDSTAEGAVIHALQQAAHNRTVVMVTHRLKSARWADTLVVMESGRVAATGSWDGLIADPDGLFIQMCREQHLVQDVAAEHPDHAKAAP